MCSAGARLYRAQLQALDEAAQLQTAGRKLVPCPGSAHENEAYVDNCSICAPRWGWIEVPTAYVKCVSCTGWCPPDRIVAGGACDNCPPPAAPAPEVRHCSVKEPGAAYEGRVLERCEAVLGADVLCSVCGGGTPDEPWRATKCFAHCGSIDHFGGPLVLVTMVDRWRILLRASGRAYQAEVRDLPDMSGPWRVLKAFGGQHSDGVIGEAMTFVDGLRNEQPAKLPYTPPTVTTLDAAEVQRRWALRDTPPADRGDETCSEADGFDPEEWQGVTISGLAQALRAPRASSWVLTRKEAAVGLERLALEISHAWGELEEFADERSERRLFERARALSDAAVCAVISLLAGGVR